MNRALKTVGALQQARQRPHLQPHGLDVKKSTERTSNPIVDIHLRATVVGSVLEEILQSHQEHWEHWGLND